MALAMLIQSVSKLSHGVFNNLVYSPFLKNEPFFMFYLKIPTVFCKLDILCPNHGTLSVQFALNMSINFTSSHNIYIYVYRVPQKYGILNATFELRVVGQANYLRIVSTKILPTFFDQDKGPRAL